MEEAAQRGPQAEAEASEGEAPESEEEEEQDEEEESLSDDEEIARVRRAHLEQTRAMSRRGRRPGPRSRAANMSFKRKLEAVRSFHDFTKKLKQDTGISIRSLKGSSSALGLEDILSSESDSSDSSDGVEEEDFEVDPDAVRELSAPDESYIDPETGDIVEAKKQEIDSKPPPPPPEEEERPSDQPKTLTISDLIQDNDLDLSNKNVEIAEIEGSELSLDKNAEELMEMKEGESSQDFDITEKLKEMGEISVKAVKKDGPEGEGPAEAQDKKSDPEDEKKNSTSAINMRRNIREVMDEKQLDASTLAAQRQESERLARVQEQQRIIREVQKQIALNRQNKAQQRTLQLLSGNSSILKKGQAGHKLNIPGTVLVKLPSGEIKKTSLKPGQLDAMRAKSAASGSLLLPGQKLGKPDAKADKKEVVEIVDSSSSGEESSSSSSDSDDCIMLSDSEVPPSPEPDDDPNNSGLHVNDAYNLPDEQGRVTINIGHPENEEDIFLAPQIARIIKPHQIGGVRFLFDNIIESVERFSTSTGFGCILAHSMGLGKTLQIVCFCDIFLRHTTSKTVLCIMPINTLQNWVAEFNMWLPLDAANSPLAAHGEVRTRNFPIYVLNDSHKTLAMRAKVVQEWKTSGGVLMIGYELYRLLSMKKDKKPRRKKKTDPPAPIKSDKDKVEKEAGKEGDDTQGSSDNTTQSKPEAPSEAQVRPVLKSEPAESETIKLDDDDRKDDQTDEEKKLLDEMYDALVKPGPDLVICDEGHRIKNSHSNISYALKQMRTKRRVVLTGYPLQNNLLEYWCMVDFVRPNYLGTKTEFSNMFERPIQNGQCIDSTPQDIRLMRYRAHVLHSLLVGFVQRRSHAVLQSTLPQKEEYVLLVRMTPLQRQLYDTFMNEVVRTKSVPNPLKAFAICCKIWNHPDVLYYFLKKRSETNAAIEEDLDLEEIGGTTKAGRAAGRQPGAPRRKPGPKPKLNKEGNKRGATKKPAATIPPNTSSGPPKPLPDGSYGPQYPPYGPPNQYGPPPQQYGHDQNQYPPYPGSYQNHGPGYYPPPEGGYNQNYQGNYYQQPPYGNNYPNQYPQNNPGQEYNPAYNNQQNYWGNEGYYGNPGYYNNQQYPNNQPPQDFQGNPPAPGYNNGQPYQQPFPGAPPTSYPNTPNPTFPNNQPPEQFPQNRPPYPPNPNFPNQNYPAYPPGQDQAYPNGPPPQGYPNNQPYPSSSYSNNAYDPYNPQGPSYPPYDPNRTGPNAYPGYGSNPNVPALADAPANSAQPNPNAPNTPATVPPNQPPSDQPPPMNSHPYPVQNPPPANQNANGLAETPVPATPAPFDYESQNTSFPTQDMNGEIKGPFPSYSVETKPPLGSADDLPVWPLTGALKTEPDVKPQLLLDEKTEIKSESDSEVKIEDLDTKKILLNDGTEIKPEKTEVKKEEKKAKDQKSEEEKSEDESPKKTKRKPPAETKGKKERLKPGPKPKSRAKNSKDRKTSKEKEKNDKSDSEESEKEDKKDKEEEAALAKKAEEMTYDWATELLKDYVPGIIENSAKMELFFCILNESIKMGDRLLLFSQSLFTLNLIEDFLERNYIPGTNCLWERNTNYYRLDGSTHALEREKLINEFNANPHVYLFLVSTRAGSLGINLVGANRVIVFDASWNPCHDTQAVCRVYRYGQKKPCFVYRFVMDYCLEKKIYDRQINKQGMADRVVDECNPDAVLSMKEITNLCWDNDEKEPERKDLQQYKDKYIDVLMQKVIVEHANTLSKEPFQHESLLVDRKEKKLSSAEKRLAQRGYELEKKAAAAPKPTTAYRTIRTADGTIIQRPVASVRPMQHGARWIPADVWRRQGMTAQEMTLPLDVVIPTNSAEKTNIVLKAGQRVMVLKSPKGIYMQLESGKIIAIKTSFKVGQKGAENKDSPVGKKILGPRPQPPNLPGSLKNNSAITVIPKGVNRPMQKIMSRPSIMGQNKARPLAPGQKIQEFRPRVLGSGQRMPLMRKLPIQQIRNRPNTSGVTIRPVRDVKFEKTEDDEDNSSKMDVDNSDGDTQVLDSGDENEKHEEKTPEEKPEVKKPLKKQEESENSSTDESKPQRKETKPSSEENSSESSAKDEAKSVHSRTINLLSDEKFPVESTLENQPQQSEKSSKISLLKNYRHRPAPKAPPSESSLSRLERTASAVTGSGAPDFRRSLDDITHSYSPSPDERPGPKSRKKKPPVKKPDSSSDEASRETMPPVGPKVGPAYLPPAAAQPVATPVPQIVPHPGLPTAPVVAPVAGAPQPGTAPAPLGYSAPVPEPGSQPYGHFPGYAAGYGAYPPAPAPYYPGYGPGYYPPYPYPPHAAPDAYPPPAHPPPPSNPQW